MVPKLQPRTENNHLEFSSDNNFQTLNWAKPVQEVVCHEGLCKTKAFITVATMLVAAVGVLFVEEE